MRILVTGGAGFIGSAYVHHMAEYTNHELVVLDALTYAGNRENIQDLPITFIHGDIADEAVVARAMEGIDWVVHFAAESHVDSSIWDASLFVRTNVLGTEVLLRHAYKAHVKRFHHVSTDEVFGHLPLEALSQFTEETALAPRNPYSATKAGAEHLVRVYGHTFGLPYSISNCSNNYGPRQHVEKVIPRFITAALNGEDLPIFGDGQHVRDYLHVSDHVRAITQIMENPLTIGETYLIAAGNEKATLDIAKDVLAALGLSESRIRYVQDRPGNDRRYSLDTTKIRNKLGWQPKVKWNEGLLTTIDHYRNKSA